MLSEVKMPGLGAATGQARVERWLVAEGGAVERGRPLLEVTAEGIEAVVEAPASGILARVLAAPGAVLPAGAVLGVIREAGPAVRPADAPSEPARPDAGRRPWPDDRAGGPEVSASPAARRLARELGIDVARVPPSTPGRRVRSEDVEAFAARLGPPAATPVPPAESRPGWTRPAVEGPTPAHRSAVPVTLAREAQVGGLVERHRRLSPGLEMAGVELTPVDLLLEAVARLLPEHPRLKARPAEGRGAGHDAVHLGVTVAADRGPVVAVLHDVDSRTLVEIARERAALAARARAGRLSREEAEGAILTVTDLGEHGADVLATAAEPASCLVLGMGRIAERAVVVEGEIRPRPVAWLSLSFDRRLVDDASAAAFLRALAERLAG